VRTLVACLGNVFRGDDAFGVRVAERLAGRPSRPGVAVRDFGVRGLDFAYALLDGYDAVVVVDASPRGRSPGTLSVLEIDVRELGPEAADGSDVETHGMTPLKALRWARSMGARLERVRLVACEPGELGTEEDVLVALSPGVAAAVEAGAELVEGQLDALQAAGEASCTSSA
jgi:hydrogenase maturation protease